MVAISLLTPLTNSQNGDGITVLCSSLPLQTFLLPKSARQSFVSYIITLFPSSLFVTVIPTEPPVLTSLPSFHKDFCSWLIATLEKAMAPHSSTLAWKVPWTEEPCRLQSMGSLRVAHDWVTSLSLFTFTHWRRQWQPTPVFLPGESQRRGSLKAYLL